MRFIKGFFKFILYTILFGMLSIIGAFAYGKMTEYTGDDLTIEDTFFDTINKQYESEKDTDKNGYNDFVTYIEGFSSQSIAYMDNLSTCLYNEGDTSDNSSCTRAEKQLTIDYSGDKDAAIKKMKTYYLVNKAKVNKLMNNDFIILPQHEIVDPYSTGGGNNILVYTGLIQYARALTSLAYIYKEEGNLDKTIDIIIHQNEFIKYLKNKADLNLIGVLSVMTIDSINTKALDFIIKNTDLSVKQKILLSASFTQDLELEILSNGIKHEYKFNSYIINNIDTMIGATDMNIPLTLVYTFLFSKTESLALEKKYYSEVLIQKENYTINSEEQQPIWHNISNIGGRLALSGHVTTYSQQFIKEADIIALKKEILETLK